METLDCDSVRASLVLRGTRISVSVGGGCCEKLLADGLVITCLRPCPVSAYGEEGLYEDAGDKAGVVRLLAFDSSSSSSPNSNLAVLPV